MLESPYALGPKFGSHALERETELEEKDNRLRQKWKAAQWRSIYVMLGSSQVQKLKFGGARCGNRAQTVMGLEFK